MSWWSLKKCLLIRGGSDQPEYSASGEYKGELKPALFFLQSTFQVIINKIDGAFWQASGGTVSTELWL